MSSNLKEKITWMVLGLNSASEGLAADIAKAVRRACEHTAHDVVVSEAARTRVLHEYGRLEGFKKEVASITADMERSARSMLAWPDYWPHRNGGDVDVFASSDSGASATDPQPPKRFVDAFGTPAVQQLKKLFELYGYAFPHTLLRWPEFPTKELSTYLQEVRKLRDLQRALAEQESGPKSVEELWLKT